MKIVLLGSLAAAMVLPGATALRAQNTDTTTAPRSAPSTEPQRVVLCSEGFSQNVACGVRIANVVNGGTILELQDGTVWEVYLPDRTSTATWRKGDYVLVRRSPLAQGSYDYTIVNGRADGEYGDSGTRAYVRFRGNAPDQSGG